MPSRTRTFTEHVAHMEAITPKLVPGARIEVIISGKTGVLVRYISPHNGWRVRWDDPVFGVEEGSVTVSQIERVIG